MSLVWETKPNHTETKSVNIEKTTIHKREIKIIKTNEHSKKIETEKSGLSRFSLFSGEGDGGKRSSVSTWCKHYFFFFENFFWKNWSNILSFGRKVVSLYCLKTFIFIFCVPEYCHCEVVVLFFFVRCRFCAKLRFLARQSVKMV